MKNPKNIIIGALIIVIMAMAVGYSAFATQLTLNGTTEIIGEWEVKIVGIEAKQVSEGCEEGELQYTNTSATFNAKLVKPSDSITYEVTIQNSGTIDAKLGSIKFTPDDINGSSAILYTNTSPADSLPAGEQTTFTVTVQYDPEATEVPSITTKSITGIVEYVQD